MAKNPGMPNTQAMLHFARAVIDCSSVHEILSCPDYFRNDVSVYMLYKAGHHCFLPRVPIQYSLYTLFEKHGDLEADNFKARKTHGHEQAASLIWFWHLDGGHSFNLNHRQVMANILVFTIIEDELGIPTEIQEFVKAYMDAFRNQTYGRAATAVQVEGFVHVWCR